MHRLSAAVLVLGVALGCTSPLIRPDAGDLGPAPAPGPGGPALPEAPRIPWLEAGQPVIAAPAIPWLDAGVPPIAWDCSAGWRSVEADGVTTCEPYPEGGSAVCGEGEAHFPGEAGCRPIGGACGDGPFPAVDDLPADAPLLYVDARAGVSGDGSEGAPLRTLAAALDRAAPGAVVVLAGGSYAVDRTWPDGVSLRGRCVRETRLVVPEENARSAVLDIARHGTPLAIEGVHIGPADVGGLRVRRRGAPVHLDGVEVAGTLGEPAAVVVASTAEVEARSLVVRDTRDPPSSFFGGAGISVESGGRLSLVKAVVDRNREVGLAVVQGGSSAVITDLAVRGTRGRSRTGIRGYGILVEEGDLELRGALVEDNRDVGLLALGAGTAVRASDLVIRDTLPQESDDAFGRGISVELEGRVEVTRALIERNREHGVIADRGGVAVLRDVLIRDTEAALGARRDRGRGVSVEQGGRVELEGCLLVRNRETGFFVIGEGSVGVASDLVVRDTRPREEDGFGGDGVRAQDGGLLRVSRALLADNRERGLSLFSADTEAEVEDLVVRGGVAEAEETFLAGVFVAQGPRLTLRRALLEETLAAGVVVVGEDAVATIEDLVVREAVPHPFAARSGGVRVEPGGSLTLRRALLDRAPEVGLIVFGRQARASVRSLAVRDTQPDARRQGGGGVGVGVQDQARLELQEALVERSRTVGVVAFGAGAETVVQDLVVRDTLALAFDRPDAVAGEFGRAMAIARGAHLVLDRALLADNRELGLFLEDDGTRAEVTDLHVRDNRGQDIDGRLGQGVVAQFGPALILDRALVENTRFFGVGIATATAEVTDLTVRDTASNGGDGRWGRGLNLARGATLTLRRARLEGNREVGLAAFGSDTQVDIEGLVVEGTLPPSCTPVCSGAGVNLGAYRGAAVDVTDFTLVGGETCGVQVTDDAQLDLSDGEVLRHPIGVCCESRYAFARLRRQVAYRDNGSVVECAAFPIPDPGPLP
ncbi:MAG: right-handed parallel beta-helix repeat-containing protein [Sandaracinaceae bacterium]